MADLLSKINVKIEELQYFLVQGLEIYPRPGDGKIISNQSLVIQKVKKEDAGNYTCQAFNVEGQMESPPQMLDIMCEWIENWKLCKYPHSWIVFIYCSVKPTCLTEQKLIYGVSEKETAHISCTVDSNPRADSFFWTLNTTAGRTRSRNENEQQYNVDLSTSKVIVWRWFLEPSKYFPPFQFKLIK